MKPTLEIMPSLMRRGIPERSIRASMEELSSTDAIKHATERWKGLRVIGGKPGVGKSVAAVMWLMQAAKGKPECMRWVQSGDLSRGYAYDKEEFDSICNVFALVIDDLGLEYLDEPGRYLCTLDEILSKRFAKMRSTLITTNVTKAEDFVSRYKDRIASRINEDGAFIVVSGNDLRREPA